MYCDWWLSLRIHYRWLYTLQDVGEDKDTDDMYDELLNNYGKVVYKSKDRKPASAEVDDDAESLSCKLISSFVNSFATTLFIFLL